MSYAFNNDKSKVPLWNLETLTKETNESYEDFIKRVCLRCYTILNNSGLINNVALGTDDSYDYTDIIYRIISFDTNPNITRNLILSAESESFVSNTHNVNTHFIEYRKSDLSAYEALVYRKQQISITTEGVMTGSYEGSSSMPNFTIATIAWT